MSTGVQSLLLLVMTGAWHVQHLHLNFISPRAVDSALICI